MTKPDWHFAKLAMAAGSPCEQWEGPPSCAAGGAIPTTLRESIEALTAVPDGEEDDVEEYVEKDMNVYRNRIPLRRRRTMEATARPGRSHLKRRVQSVPNIGCIVDEDRLCRPTDWENRPNGS